MTERKCGEIILAVEPIARRRHDGDYYGDSEYIAGRLCALEKEHIKGLNQLNGTEFLNILPLVFSVSSQQQQLNSLV